MRLFVPVVVLAASLVAGCSEIPFITPYLQQAALIAAPSVSGDWLVVRPGVGSFTWTLVEKDGKLTGGTSDGSAISGSRNKNEVTVSITSGGNFIIYSGKVTPDGKTIEGKILNETSDKFTAERK